MHFLGGGSKKGKIQLLILVLVFYLKQLLGFVKCLNFEGTAYDGGNVQEHVHGLKE